MTEKTLDKFCVVCGNSFKPITNKKTCSEVCSYERNKQRALKYHYKNLDYSRRVKRINSKRYRDSNPEKRLLLGAKQRSKENNIEFSISMEDIFIPEICPILKKPLVIGTRYAPSLDRKDPAKGYTKDNVWVISRKANVMKNDATKEELRNFSQWLLSTLS